jgi:PPOX class probable F420-dependent enzyme
MRLEREDALRLAAAADHAIFGSIGADGRPDLVPACFAIAGDVVGIPIDQVKPKASTRLQREVNVDRDSRATLLLEHWDADDWARLWWVRLRLERSTEAPSAVGRLEALLRSRYRQYAEATFGSILTFRITAVSGWSASPQSPDQRGGAPDHR